MDLTEKRLREVLDNPNSSTSEYRAAWNAMNELQFRRRCDQARYDAQVDELIAKSGSNCFEPCKS